MVDYLWITGKKKQKSAGSAELFLIPATPQLLAII
jgi:hypothetical protein